MVGGVIRRKAIYARVVRKGDLERSASARPLLSLLLVKYLHDLSNWEQYHGNDKRENQ